jgi:hypothetical protein
VPKARLELARLASEVFETSASTIPPLGPAMRGLAAQAGGVNGHRQAILALTAVNIVKPHISSLTAPIYRDWQGQSRKARRAVRHLNVR